MGIKGTHTCLGKDSEKIFIGAVTFKWDGERTEWRKKAEIVCVRNSRQLKQHSQRHGGLKE